MDKVKVYSVFSLLINAFYFQSLEVPNAIFYKNWSKDETYKNLYFSLICMQRGFMEVKLTLGPFGVAKLDNFKLVSQRYKTIIAWL